MNDYDKAGRYLVKRDPTGVLRWLVHNPRLSFRAWIDARRVALPNQNDLTNDSVAAVQQDDVLEAICLELEAEAMADIVPRQLEYLARLWAEPPTPGSFPIACVSGVVLDLTGRSAARELRLHSGIVSGCHLELTIHRRHLADEDAHQVVSDVVAGTITPWLLAWVPLMHGGSRPGIIQAWLTAAEGRWTDERDQAALALLTRVFATLAKSRPAWDQVLQRWNMETVDFLDEIRAKIRAEASAEARAEGRTEEALALVVRMGRRKFRKAPTQKQRQKLDAITDLSQLESLAERLLTVDSWAELLGNGSQSE